MLNLLQLSGFNRNRTLKKQHKMFFSDAGFIWSSETLFPHRGRPFIQLQFDHNCMMQVNRKMPKI